MNSKCKNFTINTFRYIKNGRNSVFLVIII